MITLLIILSSSLISSGITYLITKKYQKYHISKLGYCPFNNACTQFSDSHTKEAAARVAKLLIQNIQEDTEYKKAVRSFILETSKNS